MERQKRWRASPRGRFKDHRDNARRRGIPFHFTFDQWWSMWEPHWHKRGRGNGAMMCRLNDEGPYSPENCRIDLGENNIRERFANKLTGIGWASDRQKWRAYYCKGRKTFYLGDFSDWFDALCARKSAEAKNLC